MIHTIKNKKKRGVGFLFFFFNDAFEIKQVPSGDKKIKSNTNAP